MLRVPHAVTPISVLVPWPHAQPLVPYSHYGWYQGFNGVRAGSTSGYIRRAEALLELAIEYAQDRRGND